MIDAKTKFLCVIGKPIEHSLSPLMHNAAFKHLNLNYAYLAFSVDEENLEHAIEGFKALGFIGANVTIPHKVRVINYLDSLSEEAEQIGAVNTVKFQKENGKTKAIGYNTDAYGALKALEEAQAGVDNKKILILGSGGAARAIAFGLALKKKPKEIVILGRTFEKAKILAEKVSKFSKKCLAKHWNEENLKRSAEQCDILINCTPVGMHPHVNSSPVKKELLRKDMVVFDIVYNPVETRLLKEAKEIGARVIDGVDMFVYQGAEALKIWLGIEAPVKIMKKAVLEKLKEGKY